MGTTEYDLIAVGGGTAGLVSAAGGAYLGARTAIVERQALGGDCLWTGCVPSKALLAAARSAHDARTADRLGLPTANLVPEGVEVMDRMRAARARVAVHDDPERFQDMGVGIHLGAARMTGPDTLEVEGEGTLRSKRIVIATGARPIVPPIDGLAEAGYVTHEEAFDRDRVPRSALILGGGPIGLEFAQIYSRLGSSVTVLEALPEVLPHEDPDIAQLLRETLEAEGIRFALQARAIQVDRKGDTRIATTESGDRYEGELLFVATGRRPNTDGLGLRRAGVELDGAAVRVDDRLRTSRSGIWAAGDVTGRMQFTHAADAMAKTVVRNALVPFSSKVDLSNVPRVTYTDPEVAHVGSSTADAERDGGTAYEYRFDDLDRAIVDAATAGFTRISADRKGRILGATIIAKGAGELIVPIVLARRHGLKLADISNTIFPYPTMAEGVKRTADAFQRGRLDGPSGALLRRVVRWLA